MVYATAKLLVASLQWAAMLANARILHTTITHSSSASASECQGESTEQTVVHNGHCYRLITTSATWVHARTNCYGPSSESSGHLVAVPDATVQSWLVAELSSHGWTDVQGVWLGLNDRSDEGQYVWDQGLLPAKQAVYTNWEMTTSHARRRARTCVYMRPSSDWKWIRTDCNSPLRKYSYVCQYPLANATSRTTLRDRTPDKGGASEEPQSVTTAVYVALSRRSIATDPTITELTLSIEEFETSITAMVGDSELPSPAPPSAPTPDVEIYPTTNGFAVSPSDALIAVTDPEQPTHDNVDVTTSSSFADLASSRLHVLHENSETTLEADRPVSVQLNAFWTPSPAAAEVAINNTTSDFSMSLGETEPAVADLDQTFRHEPTIIYVEIFQQVNLTCMAPEGVSPPSTFWLKNGEEIIVNSNINYDFTNGSRLIISQAQTADEANYTCIARNELGVQRVTDSAVVYVNVHGGWTSWTPWTTCGSNLCSAAVRRYDRRKHRECKNPAPRHRGRPCEGAATQTASCSVSCSSVRSEPSGAAGAEVSCTDLTNVPHVSLKGSPTGYSVGEQHVDAYCTAAQPLITWKCSNTSAGTAVWMMMRNETCPRNEDIERLSRRNVTVESVSSILREAVNATMSSDVTNRPFGLAVNDVSLGSLILSNVIALVVQEPHRMELSDVITAVPAIVSKIMDAPGESLTASNTSSSISRNVEALISVAASAIRENTTITHVQPNVVVQMTSDPEIVGIEVTSDGTFTGETVRPVRAGESGNREQAEAVVFFAPEARDLRKSFAVFNNAKLFQGKSMYPANDMILSAQLAETVLHPELVTILFRLPAVQNQTSSYEEVECGFWNYSENDWSTFGCKKTPASGNRVACLCNHTTNFAVLFKVYEERQHEDVHRAALSLITRVGLSASIALLLVVIISFLLLRKLRRTVAQKVLFNISLSICLLDVSFLIGIERIENTATCVAFAALIHTFVLTSFAWMSVEASLHYLKLVKIFAAIPTRFFIKAAVPAWGLPATIVSSLIIADYRFYDSTQDGVCWVQKSIMHYGVLLPVSLSIAYNGVLFVLISHSLFSSNAKSVRSTMSKTERLKMRARAGFAVFALMGLSWTFGYFAIHGAQLVFQYLFCLCNSLQGALIALLHCLLGKLLPREWRRLLGRSSGKESSSSVSRNATFSSTLNASVNRKCETTRL